jgi:WD40 repeat protein
MRIAYRPIFAYALVLVAAACVVGSGAASAQSGTYGNTAAVDWHPGGRYLAVANIDTVAIIDTLSDVAVNVFPKVNGHVYSPGTVAWSPNGELLAYSDYSEVHVVSRPWDMAQTQHVSAYDYYAAYSPPTRRLPPKSIDWSPDSQRYGANISGIVDVVNAATGEFQRRITGEIPSGPVAITSFQWTADDRILATTRQGVVAIFDPSSGALTGYLEIGIGVFWTALYGLALDPTGQQAVFGSDMGEVFRWRDTHNPSISEVDQWAWPSEDGDTMILHAWSPSGQYVATGTADGDIFIREVVNGSIVETIALGSRIYVNGMAWNPDGSALAYGLPDGSSQLLDASTLPGYVPMATPTPP